MKRIFASLKEGVNKGRIELEASIEQRQSAIFRALLGVDQTLEVVDAPVLRGQPERLLEIRECVLRLPGFQVRTGEIKEAGAV